ncbi:MAG: amidohydrolase, partial [Candidatus Eisenbacteria bacterium]|nr:amidohydrolase [Candidatus Eisenbacteria bacterium]
MKTAPGTLTDAELQELIDVRRDLHSHPEIAFEEVRTSGIVAERLRAMGLTPRTGVGRTGVLATIEGGKPGRTVLLRADMDALPIQEENATPYRSQTDGKMHACGHDCHTSILLGVSRQLVKLRSSLSGNVRLCFQPAEEQGGGARAMIADGALEGPRPDAAFGLHVWQDLDLGQIGVTPGPWMAAVDEFNVTLHGHGAHAAAPHQGFDPVLCLSHVIAALQSIASRTADPLKEVVVSVTQVRSGSAFNIIPGEAELALEFRASEPKRFAELEAALLGLAQVVGRQYGLRLGMEPVGQCAPAPMSARAQAAIASAADSLALTHAALSSCAGHDAQSLAPLTDAGMIFIPSRDGISHAPLE